MESGLNMLKKINTYCEICNKKLTKKTINTNTKKGSFSTNVLNCYNPKCEIGLKNLKREEYVKKNSKKIDLELNNIVKKIIKELI
jgi:ribosomal protein L44E